ncbi:MAG: hypothetical protein ABJ327_21990 [Litoreibacter sp.]
MNRRAFLAMGGATLLVGCGAESIVASDEDVRRAIYLHPGPKSLSLITVINNRSGSGGHTGLLINASQRVIWDPAGTWWSPNAPERNDLHYGMNERLVDVYIDYHTRETYHTVMQTKEVSPAVAEQAFREAAANGAASKATCSLSTSRILNSLPGFESIRPSYYPVKTMNAFAELGVVTQKFYDDDADDNSQKLGTG